MRFDWFFWLVFVLLLSLYSYFLMTPVNLATADLGRHIKNGELLFTGNFGLLYSNYYSYTNPDYPFVNHHWFGGMVFYIFNILGGFLGVQLLFIVVSLAALGVFFYVSVKYSNVVISAVAALLFIPLIIYRDEVRPEIVSYLFAGIYYLVLRGFLDRKVPRKWLFSLIGLQIIWVNTHIYFFVGFLILGGFWLEEVFKGIRAGGWSKEIKELTILLVACGWVSLLNPHFGYGLIYPFQILGNYGYRVLENQSVFFLENVIAMPVIIYFKVGLAVLVLSWVYAFYRLIRFKEGVSVTNVILSVGLSYLAFTQVRNFALFGFFGLMIVAMNLKNLKVDMSKYLIFPGIGVLLVLLLILSPEYWETRAFGLGVIPGMERAAEFFKRENIKGPIFNNYDIGGYLIYYLFPKEKVFVDNRPEGYPVEFFTKTYVPMQENEELWKEKLHEYNFNSIFFYRLDLTPWGQTFLLARIKDPEWAEVFVDDYNIIFVRRNEENAELIKKYELPKEMFGFK